MKALNSIIIILIGFIMFSCSGDEQEPGEKYIPVKTAEVHKGILINPVSVSGKVEASLESKLSFKVAGIVESINYDEGEFVKKGSVIASLNLSEIKANVKKASQAYEKAKRDYKRISNLYKDEVVTLEQYQNSETALEMAKSDREIAEFNLTHSVIKAPSDGIILKKLVHENEIINPGYPVVLFGSQTNNWKIVTSVSDQNLTKIKIGDSAAVSFGALSGAPVSGKVTVISKFANPYNGSYEVEISLDKTNRGNGTWKNIASGMIASVVIFPETQHVYYFIPIESLIEADNKTGYVFIPRDSSVIKTKVKIKALLKNRIAIEEGLENISEVVTDGAGYLSENSKIKIVN